MTTELSVGRYWALMGVHCRSMQSWFGVNLDRMSRVVQLGRLAQIRPTWMSREMTEVKFSTVRPCSRSLDEHLFKGMEIVSRVLLPLC